MPSSQVADNSRVDCNTRSNAVSRAATIHGLLLGSLLVVGACSSGPTPRLHLLEAPTQTFDPFDPLGQNRRAPTPVVASVGTADVVLPDYASDDAVATRQQDGELAVSASDQWAEPPVAAVTRLFAQRLRAQSGSQVLVKPFPRDYQPKLRVELVFDHLYRLPDGGVSMAGQVLYLSGDGRRLGKVRAFNYRQQGQSLSMDSFFRAVALGIDAIAAEVSAELVNGKA